jgi:tetratricopeptide (TPR) repeat protein
MRQAGIRLLGNFLEAAVRKIVSILNIALRSARTELLGIAMAIVPQKSVFKLFVIASGFISIGLALATPARTQTAQQRAWCDIKGGAMPDEVIGSCTAIIQSGQETGRNLAAAFTIRGRAYRAKGDYGRAIADYTDAIRIEPNYVLAFYSRGVAYFNKGDYGRAIADYTESLRLAPRDIIALQNRGHAYQARQDYARAIADYTAAIEIEPKFAYAFNDRCYARANAGRELQQALDDCNETLRLMPNDLHTLDSRGFAYLRLGEFDNAIKDYDAVLKFNPRQAASLYGRGLAKRNKGDGTGGEADIAAAKAIRAGIAEEFARFGVK